MKRFSYLDMVKTLLPEREFEAFAQSYTKPLKKSIKILKSNQHISAIHEQLTNEGRSLIPPNFSRKGKIYDDVLFVDKTDKYSLGNHPLHQQGAFYVQEMAAGLPAQILNIQPGEIVLDICAAPGGKSIQLADKLGTNGLLVANELNPSRRKALKANLERCGIRNAIITGYDGKELGDLLYEQCDKVLLDAPCSGEGMQYKPDFKIYQRNEKQAKKLAHTQYELFISGFKALKIGGELVYSTCTTNTIENEGVVMKVLETLGDSIELVNVEIEEKFPGLPIHYDDTRRGASLMRPNKNKCRDVLVARPNDKVVDNVARFRPHIHHTGGFFIAKFKKTKSGQHKYRDAPCPAKLRGSLMCPPTSNNTKRNLIQSHEMAKLHNIGQRPMTFLQTKHTIRAVAKKAIGFLDLLHIDQAGFPIFKILNNGEWKPLEGLEKLLNFKNQTK